MKIKHVEHEEKSDFLTRMGVSSESGIKGEKESLS